MNKNDYSILVVEDEETLVKAVKAKLENSGFSVVTARTAGQAWNNIQDGVGVDAVWLDHYLIGNDTGLEFLARLKADDRFKSLPVFVVSNTATADKKQAYIEFGISEYFVKSNHRLDQIIEAITKRLEADAV